MDNIDKMKVSNSATIFSSLQIIDACNSRVALVVDSNDMLVGTLSDGDIRRALLSGASLHDRIDDVYNVNFVYSLSHQLDSETFAKAKKMDVNFVPVIDPNGRILGGIRLGPHTEKEKRSETVILMMGGLGTRLRPLTLDTPKPLLPVGGIPIAEIILDQLISSGFRKFIFSINYKGDQIREHFGDGHTRGATISYIEEAKRMGTAGSLSLIDDTVEDKVVVMNGDLLTKINFVNLLKFTDELGADGAVCVRSHNYTVPYGVVRANSDHILFIEEKPTETFFVNAGVYVLSSSHLKRVPQDKYYDMPMLINELVKDGEKIVSFPVHEYWLDIGEISQYEKAQSDFHHHFEKCDLK